MKKHWSLFLGASLITGIAGSLFLKKKQEKQAESSIPDSYKNYIGSWWFINNQKATQHTLTIENDLQILIDNRKLNYMLVELTNTRLVAQDEYGYHLIIQCIDRKPMSLYDEADDVTYLLESKNKSDALS